MKDVNIVVLRITMVKQNMDYNEYYNGDVSDQYLDYQLQELQQRKTYDKFIYFLSQPDKKILDVAGGNGVFMHLLRNVNVTILDICTRYKQSNPFNYKYVFGDVNKTFPFKDNKYDVVYLAHILEHLYHPNHALVEACRVLKRKGIAYIIQPNTAVDGKFHVRNFTKKEIISDVEKSGFKILDIQYYPCFNKGDYNLMSIKGFIGWILHFIPYNIRVWLAEHYHKRFCLIMMIKAEKSICK